MEGFEQTSDMMTDKLKNHSVENKKWRGGISTEAGRPVRGILQ